MTGDGIIETKRTGLAQSLVLAALLPLFFLSSAGCDTGVWKRISDRFDRQGKIVSIKGHGIEWTASAHAAANSAAHADKPGYGDEMVFKPEKSSAKCLNNSGDTSYGVRMTIETNMAGLEIKDLKGQNLRALPGESCFRESNPCEENSGCPYHYTLKSEIKKDDYNRPYFERTYWIDLGRQERSYYPPAQGERFSLTVRAIGNEKDETRNINVYAVTERPQIIDFRIDRDRVPRQGGVVRLHAGLRYATGFTLRDQDGKIIQEENRDVWSVDKNALDFELNIKKTTLLTIVARNPAGANQQNVLVRVE